MIEAALDTSYGIALAIADSGQPVLNANASFERRASDAALVPWVEDRFHEAGLSTASVTRWTVGVGPGSFTGLRCGIAFVKGICLQSAARCRGLPSSVAVALEAIGDAGSVSEVAVLNDARRGQLILSRFTCADGVLSPLEDPTVVSPEDLVDLTSASASFCSIHQEEIEDVLPEDIRQRTTFVAQVGACRLLAPPGWEWPESEAAEASLEPIYVRPPVFVEPNRRVRVNLSDDVPGKE
jgi:tRNA threonylcarbamoyladenosine biosynthesis protein TsaB